MARRLYGIGTVSDKNMVLLREGFAENVRDRG